MPGRSCRRAMNAGTESRSASLRCFIALPLSPSAAADVDRLLAPLRRRWPTARWVPAADLHLTIAFLGAVPSERRPAIEAALARVARTVDAFEIGLDGAGSFGGRGRPRVAWLGIGAGRHAVIDLSAAVARALDLEPSGEARPHLTVARGVEPELAAALRDRVGGELTWRAEAVVLYRSHLGPPRSRYEALGRWPLGADLEDRLAAGRDPG